MKAKRLEEIIKIIETEDVCTQEGLLNSLKEKGYDVTQATVSRDIKSLDLVKVMTEEGKYRYKRQESIKMQKSESKFKSVFLEAVIKVDYAMNIVVLKCHTGMGNAACAAIDLMEHNEVVGTLAGDDTVFILLKDCDEAIKFSEKIKMMLGL